MAIPLRCPRCGKQYRLRDELAGKRVKCRCGIETTVPASAGEGAGSSRELELDEPRGSAPEKPPAQAPQEDYRTDGSAAAPSPRPRKRRAREDEKWRIPVGVLSIVYGGVAAGVIVFLGVRAFPAGAFSTVTRSVLAVLIVVGGVLILKRHPHGPACAGLSCIFLCFFRLGWMLLVVLAALTTGEVVGLLQGVVVTVVLYCIPVCITIWCLRQELAKKQDSEFLD